MKVLSLLRPRKNRCNRAPFGPVSGRWPCPGFAPRSRDRLTHGEARGSARIAGTAAATLTAAAT